MKDAALSDAKLIEKSIAGDENAFELLVRKYHRKIISIIFQIIGNKQDAEDIAQEVFIKVFYRLNDYNPRCPFYAWLYRITINRCYDYLRAKKRVRTKSFSELNQKDIKTIHALFTQFNAKTISIEDRENVEEILNKLLLSLKPKEKTVIAMRDIENLSYEEISEILQCSELAARIKVSRARKKLRAELEGYLKEET